MAVKEIFNIVKKVAKKINHVKPKIDSWGLPVLTYAAGNAGILYGAFKVSESDLSDPAKILIGLGGGAVGYVINRYPLKSFAKVTRKYSLQKARTNRHAGILNWLLTAGLAFGIIETSPAIVDNIDTIIYDIKRPRAEDLFVKGKNLNDVKLAKKNTLTGRIQRTERWRCLTDTLEKKNGMPEGILRYIIMEESFGDPFEINKDDGGAGLINTQPAVANEEGLKVYQNCKKLISKEHAQELLKLIKKFDHNLDSLAKYDDRFDSKKLLSKRSKSLIDSYAKFGNWDDAIAAVNCGGDGVYNKNGKYTPRAQRYLGRIKGWERGYKNHYKETVLDFAKRNPGKNFSDWNGGFRINGNGNHQKR